MVDFSCDLCHSVYAQKGKPKTQAPDLRGYMSRDWMIGIIADPTSKRFYGPDIPNTKKGNDRMPAFHVAGGDEIMTMQEIETLVDWLRGKWYRYEKKVPVVAPQPVKEPAPEAVVPAPTGLQPLEPVHKPEGTPVIP